MSLKLISRGVAAVLLTAGIASAQLMNTKSLDVIRVDKTGISAGKIDSLATMLGQQQAPGQKLTEEMMTQLRYAVVDNLVGQELVKLEAKKLGIKVEPAKVDSLTALFKKQFPSEEAFQKELKKSNTTMAQFKTKIEDQLKSEKILEKKVPYPEAPTEKQLQAFWELNKSKGANFAKAVAKIKVGEISEVITDNDGVSIFMLTEKNDGKYESYKHQIDYILRVQAEQDRQAKLKGYLDELGKTYKVQYLDKKYEPPQAIGASK